MFLVARVFANLWIEATRKDAADRRLLKDMAAACRALSSQAWSFPIAAPSAAIARGYLARFRGRTASATRYWRRAAANASRLDMSYEARLALRALGEAQRADSRRPGPSLPHWRGVDGCAMNRTPFLRSSSRTPSGVSTRTSRPRFPDRRRSCASILHRVPTRPEHVFSARRLSALRAAVLAEPRSAKESSTPSFKQT